jgi:transcriptional regulator with XRE-family HTH domain
MKRLREYRQEAGLTQGELGQLVGYHQSEISRIERGEHTITVDRLLKLAEVLGVRAADLLDEQEAA